MENFILKRAMIGKDALIKIIKYIQKAEKTEMKNFFVRNKAVKLLYFIKT